MSKKPERFPIVSRHPLARWRFERDLPLKVIAEELDTAPGYLSQIESRKLNPSMKFAQRLCDLTGLKLDDFAPERR